MINFYSLGENVTPDRLQKAGFEKKGVSYVLHRPIYNYTDTNKPYIFFNMEIMVGHNGEAEIFYDVSCDDGELYAPFYNPFLRHGNEVYKLVNKKFNNIIKDLINKGILSED